MSGVTRTGLDQPLLLGSAVQPGQGVLRLLRILLDQVEELLVSLVGRVVVVADG